MDDNANGSDNLHTDMMEPWLQVTSPSSGGGRDLGPNEAGLGGRGHSRDEVSLAGTFDILCPIFFCLETY